MRTPTNGHSVKGRVARGYPATDQNADGAYDETAYQDGPAPPEGGYQDGGYRDGHYPANGPATSGYGVTRPAAGYGRAYQTGSYPTARQQGGYGQEPGAEISGHGYDATAADATQLFQPAARQQRWQPPAELDLDTSMRGTPPPPLRSPTRRPTAAPERIGWTALGAPASPPAAPPTPKAKGPRLRVDWPNCKAHGLCHELLPEAVRLDEWGYPIVGNHPLPATILDDARRAVIACPTLALRLVE